MNGRPGKGDYSRDENKRGLDGAIVIGIQNSTNIEALQQYKIFNKYKEFVVDSMAYNIRRTATKNFIREYERSWSILYTLLIYILLLCLVIFIKM